MGVPHLDVKLDVKDLTKNDLCEKDSIRQQYPCVSDRLSVDIMNTVRVG